MSMLDKKTTSISLQPHKPLSVEWHTLHPHIRQSGKSFTQIDEHRVVLFAPETPHHPEAYLVSMLPGTALKLLKWLQENEALLTVIAELQDLLTWPDDWNSYGAQAPKPASVSRATAWITETHQHLQQSWISPHVGANGDGEVEFDWRNGQRKLSIYFDEQDIDYLQVDGKGINAPMYDGDITSIEDVQKLWQWLLEAGKEQEV